MPWPRLRKRHACRFLTHEEPNRDTTIHCAGKNDGAEDNARTRVWDSPLGYAIDGFEDAQCPWFRLVEFVWHLALWACDERSRARGRVTADLIDPG